MWHDMTALTAKMKEHKGYENPWDLFSIVVSNKQCNFVGNPYKIPLHWQMVCHSVPLILELTILRTKHGAPQPHGLYLLTVICQARAPPLKSWVLCQHPSIPTPKEFGPRHRDGQKALSSQGLNPDKQASRVS